ncbi:MAG: hypothetical protein M9894_11020 [Planctomycetes bacterium]|nr:hypothetical protein [Planctomycetota bacterium]
MPAPRRRPLAPLALLVAALAGGCPGGATGPADVRPGQRWRFRLAGLGEQVYEVTDVTPTEVRYRVRTSAGGEPLGEPLEQRFPTSPAPPPLGEGEPGPPLVVGVGRLETWVTRDGPIRTTTAVRGRVPVFPGVVRVEREGAALVELVDAR